MKRFTILTLLVLFAAMSSADVYETNDVPMGGADHNDASIWINKTGIGGYPDGSDDEANVVRNSLTNPVKVIDALWGIDGIRVGDEDANTTDPNNSGSLSLKGSDVDLNWLEIYGLNATYVGVMSQASPGTLDVNNGTILGNGRSNAILSLWPRSVFTTPWIAASDYPWNVVNDLLYEIWADPNKLPALMPKAVEGMTKLEGRSGELQMQHARMRTGNVEVDSELYYSVIESNDVIPGDLDLNGIVDGFDLAIFANNWLRSIYDEMAMSGDGLGPFVQAVYADSVLIEEHRRIDPGKYNESYSLTTADVTDIINSSGRGLISLGTFKNRIMRVSILEIEPGRFVVDKRNAEKFRHILENYPAPEKQAVVTTPPPVTTEDNTSNENPPPLVIIEQTPEENLESSKSIGSFLYWGLPEDLRDDLIEWMTTHPPEIPEE